MALSDLAVFSEYAYEGMTEVLAQQLNFFNEASRGTIQLSTQMHQGDYSDKAFWGNMGGIVRRRNAYGSGTITQKRLAHLVDTMVKVAAGTHEIELTPGQFRWIQRSPEEAGAAMGQQLAKDTLADMLNTGVMATVAAIGAETDVVYDGTAATMTSRALNNGVGKFGDRKNDILAWIMHSKPSTDFYDNALQNAERLFVYGTVNVVTDAFGRVFIVTDSPSLLTTGTPDTYHNLGLTAGAIVIDQNSDYDDNYDTKNGSENIVRTYQAEWSYNLGIKGFTWDKANGGKSPTDAALGTATNWDKLATSHKDLAGVLVNTQ